MESAYLPHRQINDLKKSNKGMVGGGESLLLNDIEISLKGFFYYTLNIFSLV